MKSIQQNNPTWFTCPEPQDIATMTMLMDTIQLAIQKKTSMAIFGDDPKTQRTFEILKGMGFCTSIPDETLPAPPEVVIIGEQQCISNEKETGTLEDLEKIQEEIQELYKITMLVEYLNESTSYVEEIAKDISDIYGISLHDAAKRINRYQNSIILSANHNIEIKNAISAVCKLIEKKKLGNIQLRVCYKNKENVFKDIIFNCN